MFTHMHYRVLGVGSLRIQGPVEREYLNNSGQAGQSDDVNKANTNTTYKANPTRAAPKS